jgi:hypothetical protein
MAQALKSIAASAATFARCAIRFPLERFEAGERRKGAAVANVNFGPLRPANSEYSLKSPRLLRTAFRRKLNPRLFLHDFALPRPVASR